MNANVQGHPSGQYPCVPQRTGLLVEQLLVDSSRPVFLGDPPQKQEHLALRELEQKMAEFVAEREAAVVELKKSFVFPGDSSVSIFLFEHRTIAPLLLESVPVLKRFFGHETVFQLRAPVDGFGSQTLYAVATWPGAAGDVRTVLGRFDEEWWLPRSYRAAGYLTFTYELI